MAEYAIWLDGRQVVIPDGNHEAERYVTGRFAEVLGRGCKAQGCRRKHNAKGYCITHYMRLKNGIDMNMPIRAYGRVICTVTGCYKPHAAKGLCNSHYGKQKRQRVASKLQH